MHKGHAFHFLRFQLCHFMGLGHEVAGLSQRGAKEGGHGLRALGQNLHELNPALCCSPILLLKKRLVRPNSTCVSLALAHYCSKSFFPKESAMYVCKPPPPCPATTIPTTVHQDGKQKMLAPVPSPSRSYPSLFCLSFAVPKDGS